MKLFLLLIFPLYVCCGRSAITQLDEHTWQELLEGEWMVEFFAPWCPACKGLQPIWEDFASWSDDLGVGIAQIDVTASPGLSGRFMVTALPTIYHVKDGVFRQYRGARDKDEFIGFVEEKKWEQVEPIPSWKSPTSPQMSAMALFFKLSMTLRFVHTTLIEEYGIPYWGSYLIFGIATIIFGAVLGLLLVFIVDMVSPQKHHSPSEHEQSESKDDDLVEEEAEKTGDETEGTEEEDEVEVSQDSQASQTESEEEEETPSDSGVRKRKTRKAD